MNVRKVSELEDVIFYEYLQEFIEDLVRRQSVKTLSKNNLKINIQMLENDKQDLKELLRKVVYTFSNNTRTEDLLIQDIMKIIK